MNLLINHLSYCAQGERNRSKSRDRVLEQELEGARGELKGLEVKERETPMEWGDDGGQQKKDGEEQASEKRMDKGENITGGMGVVLDRMKGMRMVVDKEGGVPKGCGGQRGRWGE